MKHTLAASLICVGILTACGGGIGGPPASNVSGFRSALRQFPPSRWSGARTPPFGSQQILDITQQAGQPVAVTGINNVGEIIGTAETASHAFIFDAFNSTFGNSGFGKAGFDDLGTLSGQTTSSGAAIGNATIGSSGVSVPFASGTSGTEAFVWSGSMTGLFCGCSFDQAFGVDSNGDVAGQVSSSGKDFAIVWPEAGGGNIIPPLGSAISAAQTVAFNTSKKGNGSLYIAGFEIGNSGTGPEMGFFYDSATKALISIPPLSGDNVIVPRGTNANAAIVVGDSRNASHQEHAFEATHCDLVRVQCQPTALPSLGGSQAFAYSVNDFGFIAGYAQVANGDYHAVLWRPTGDKGAYAAQDLEAFAPKGWTLSSAVGVNNGQQIVGYGANGANTDPVLLPLYDHGVDLSDYSTASGPIDINSINDLAKLGYDNFGVEIGMQSGPAKSAEQTLETIQAGPYPTYGYIFLTYNDPTKNGGDVQMKAALAKLKPATVKQLQFIAVDVETSCPKACKYDGKYTTSYQKIRQTIIADAIKAAPSGMPIMIYTSNNGKCTGIKQNCNWDFLTGLSKSGGRFSTCPLWDAKGDSLGDVDTNVTKSIYSSFDGYGVWTGRAAKQYEINIAGFTDALLLEKYSGIPALDLDVLRWRSVVGDKCTGGTKQ